MAFLFLGVDSVLPGALSGFLSRIVVYDSIMTEGGDLVFNVCRKHAYGTCSVDYAITDGTAAVDTDYDNSADALTGTLTFADRELYKTITVHTITRASAQGNRTMTCTLSNASNTTIEDATATGTIQDGTITVFTSADSIATITAALDGASAGDAILLTRGHQWDMTGGITLDETRGTSSNPIIFGATGTGAKPELNPIASFSAALWFRGANVENDESAYVHVQDIVMRSTGAPESRSTALQISESTRTYKPSNISCFRVDFLENPTGLNIDETNHTFECCTIKRNYGIPPETGHTQGLFFESQDGNIRFCEFEDNGKSGSVFDWNIYLSDADNTTLEYNRVVRGSNGIKVRKGPGITIRGNEVFDTQIVSITAGTNLGGANLSTFVAEENYIHGGQDGFTLLKQDSETLSGETASGIIRNNIVSVSVAGSLRPLSFAADSGNESWKIYNNLFIKYEGGELMRISDSITGSEIRNNIFYRPDQEGSSALIRVDASSYVSTFTASNNLFYRNTLNTYAVDDGSNTPYADLTAYNVDFSSAEANSVEGDPLFTDETNGDYSPGVGSPAINAGFDTTADVPTDFAGDARATVVEIGAFTE